MKFFYNWLSARLKDPDKRSATLMLNKTGFDTIRYCTVRYLGYFCTAFGLFTARSAIYGLRKKFQTETKNFKVFQIQNPKFFSLIKFET